MSNDERRIERLERERELYLRLLELGEQTEPEPFLKKALALLVDVAGARQGYLELHDDEGDPTVPRWSIAMGFSEEEVRAVRARVSRGIIAAAIASGSPVVTHSAMDDERFEALESVRAGRIDAVLCAPIGADPPLGVLYLQGRREPGPWSEADHEATERVARHLAPIASHVLLRQERLHAADATQPLRRRLRLEGVVGRSAALASLLREVSLVAPLDVNVLLTGQSGTGKSQIARVIHENGPRAGRPFVEVNCAALPDTLVENELFGAVPGAHSTARRPLAGKVAAAEGGTLLLEEVGELSLAAQSKLLQLLQTREYYPLGASRPLRADVRVIAATNADLEAAVSSGRFREDLFYRLQVLPLHVPPLAQRREDIPVLARHFCEQTCRRHGLPFLELSRAALREAEVAAWPGNVRQLAHAMEAAVIRANGERASSVQAHHLFPQRGAGREPAAGDRAAEESAAEGACGFQEATRRFQRQLVSDTLAETGWNVAAAARQLDLARSHLYNLIHAFGLSRDARG